MIGAPFFRYYPYVPGPYLPTGLRLLTVSDDPAETARAPVGDSLLGDAVLSLIALKDLLGDCKPKTGKAREALGLAVGIPTEVGVPRDIQVGGLERDATNWSRPSGVGRQGRRERRGLIGHKRPRTPPARS